MGTEDHQPGYIAIDVDADVVPEMAEALARVNDYASQVLTIKDDGIRHLAGHIVDVHLAVAKGLAYAEGDTINVNTVFEAIDASCPLVTLAAVYTMTIGAWHQKVDATGMLDSCSAVLAYAKDLDTK